MATDPKQAYVYRWGKFRPELKGKECVVLARGAMNSALVRFTACGTTHVVSRNALAKVKA